MIHSQVSKRVSLIKPQSVGSQTTVSATVSVVGWDYAEINVHMDTGSSNVTTLQISEADATTYATATELAMTTVAGNTNASDLYTWYLDLRKRKKNLKIEVMSSAAARLISAEARLSRGEQGPATLTAQGLVGRVVV